MQEELARDESVFVIGEDVGIRGGVFLATQGLLEEFGGERVIDTPLAEASIMGIAVGAAYRGLRPVPEVQFSDFVWPAVNQLIGEAARVCYGTNGNVTSVHLPGGAEVWFTGMRVLYAAGSPFPNIGIIPDVLARSTVRGIKSGRDEQLDAAARVLRDMIDGRRPGWRAT